MAEDYVFKADAYYYHQTTDVTTTYNHRCLHARSSLGLGWTWPAPNHAYGNHIYTTNSGSRVLIMKANRYGTNAAAGYLNI